MRLIIGAELEAEEHDAALRGYAERAALPAALARNFHTVLAEVNERLFLKRLEALQWLVSHNHLDIKVAEAPAPSRPIERGLAGPGLLAHVLVSKFADHLPLYRQSEICARQGVEIERSTLAGWVGGASELLAPLIDAIQKHVLAGAKLHADDTPMPVLSPGSGKTKTGRLWTYVRDDRPAGEDTAPAVWFAYSEDRKGEHPRQHLRKFKGGLQADAYAGYVA
jgi:hypothetical protein